VFEDIFVSGLAQVTKLVQVVGELDATGRSDFTVDFVGRTRHIRQDPRMGRYTASLARECVEHRDLEVVKIVVYPEEDELPSRRQDIGIQRGEWLKEGVDPEPKLVHFVVI
jgi:hypothetical protein